MTPRNATMGVARYSLSILIVSLLTACAQLEPRPDLPLETAIAPMSATPLDLAATPFEARFQGHARELRCRDAPRVA